MSQVRPKFVPSSSQVEKLIIRINKDYLSIGDIMNLFGLKNRMKNECPWMIGWMDSVYQHHCVKDTFVTMPSGYKAHAIYLYAPKTTEKTAVVVHG